MKSKEEVLVEDSVDLVAGEGMRSVKIFNSLYCMPYCV